MGGMEMMVSPLLGGAGDVAYPHYLINGRVPAAPVSSYRQARANGCGSASSTPASDTAFRVALGGHRLTVTHTDGFPVTPANTDALLLGMGERYDVAGHLGDGVFPLVAAAEGKAGQGLAVVRTGAGAPPVPPSGRPNWTGRSLNPPACAPPSRCGWPTRSRTAPTDSSSAAA